MLPRTPMTHAHRSVLVPAAAALLALGDAAAQNLSLDRVGGALGGVTSFPLQGAPNEPYYLLFDLLEQPTPLPALGITLGITDQFAWFTFLAPTFVGATDGSGHAEPQVAIPNAPWFASVVFTFQAIAGFGPFRVSNLVRLTPQAPNTFAPALEQPLLPILGGGTAVAPDNELLFVGGAGPAAQRYASRTEQWQLAGTTFGVGLWSQTTGLPDGRVLFTGGLDVATGQPTAAAAVYDPAAQTTTTLSMAAPRAGHGASLMGNGKVLVTGGSATLDLANPLTLFTGVQATTEIFDPATNTFAPGPNMLEARAMHTSTTLTNGQVLIAGGITLLPIVAIPTVSSTAYRFNPATNSFGLPAFFGGGRFLHTAAPLSNGRVLLVGGLTLDLTTFLQTLDPLDLVVGTRSDCQLFAPGAFGFGTFTTVTGLQVGRAGAAVAPLANGGAVIAGGFELVLDPTTSTFAFEPTATAERFAQNPNTLTPVAPMAAARLFPVAVDLPDGTVMIVGGGPAGAEIFQQ